MNGKRDERPVDSQERESGLPGGGTGRTEDVRGSGVHPASAGSAPENAVLRNPAAWGQGDRGAAGYEDAGSSELYFYEAELRAAGIEPDGEHTGEAARKPQTAPEEEDGGQT